MSIRLAGSLPEVHRATNPSFVLPSNHPYYVPTTSVRGNEDTVERLKRTITWADEGYTHQLFTGHRGSGKSTELLRLKDKLEQANFSVIYFAASDYLDINDVQYSDVILAIVRRIADHLMQHNRKLKDKLLQPILAWFGETVYAEDEWRTVQRELGVEVGGGAQISKQLPIFAKLLAKITGQIQSGTQIKTTIRRRLDPQISQLLKHTNKLLSEAAKKLNQSNKPLVIVVDNLDRIPLLEEGNDRTNHDVLYIEHGKLLCSLDAHVIYTIPVSMLYSSRGTVLGQEWPEDPSLLPMIKTHTRDGNPHQEGLAVLRKMLAQRIELDIIFTPDAVELLCEICGGHPRDLMILVRYATSYAQDRFPRPIDLAAVQQAKARMISGYRRAIPEAHYPLLARVHLDKTIASDAPHREMLYSQSVLEYYDAQLEPQQESKEWQDVHPVVLPISKFKLALQNERANRGLPNP